MENRLRIHKKIRAKIKGTEERPRLVVFRSHKHVYAQVINDVKGMTVCSASDLVSAAKKEAKSERAKRIGKEIAEKAKKEGIQKVVFDRGGFHYQGRIKKVAEGAREEGLLF